MLTATFGPGVRQRQSSPSEIYNVPIIAKLTRANRQRRPSPAKYALAARGGWTRGRSPSPSITCCPNNRARAESCRPTISIRDRHSGRKRRSRTLASARSRLRPRGGKMLAERAERALQRAPRLALYPGIADRTQRFGPQSAWRRVCATRSIRNSRPGADMLLEVAELRCRRGRRGPPDCSASSIRTSFLA